MTRHMTTLLIEQSGMANITIDSLRRWKKCHGTKVLQTIRDATAELAALCGEDDKGLDGIEHGEKLRMLDEVLGEEES